MSPSDPSAPPTGGGGRPPAAPDPAPRRVRRATPALGRAALAAIGALLAGFAATLGFCAWHGVDFALGGVPGLRIVVEGEVGPAVRLLAAVLEGPSGVWVLAGASAAAAAAGLGMWPDGPGGVPGRARGRLRRAWRDAAALADDAARWLAGLPRREGRWHAAALAAVVAGGLALRLLYLSQPVRYDEAFTFTHFAARPLELGISRYTYPNNHLLHTLLVHLATDLLGEAPEVLRLPALAAGAAVVPAAYAAWDALGEADVALAAAALAAASSPLVLYSTSARGYSLVVLCSLLLVPLAARLLRRRDRAAWALFVALSAAALHAIPVALYPYGAALAWLLLSGRSGGGADAAEEGPGDGDRDGAGGSGRGPGPGGRRPRGELLREAAAATAVVALLTGWLYLPAVQRSGVAAIVANRFVSPSPLGAFVSALPGFFAGVWAEWTRGVPAPAAALLGALAAAGLARELRSSLPGRAGAAPGRGPAAGGGHGAGFSYPLAAAGWSLLLLALTRRTPFARAWLFLLPVFGLLVARGGRWALGLLARRAGDPLAGRGEPASRGGGRRWAGPAAALLLLAGLGGSVVAADSVVESPSMGPFPDGEEAAAVLEERLGPRDAVLALGPAEVVLEYHFRRLGLPARVNVGALRGGTQYLLVDRGGGQELADLLARLGVAGAGSVRVREVASFERSTLYALPPPGEGG